MEKAFEPHFTAIQAGMVSLCLEYCKNSASKVYIIADYDDDDGACSFSSNFLFQNK